MNKILYIIVLIILSLKTPVEAFELPTPLPQTERDRLYEIGKQNANNNLQLTAPESTTEPTNEVPLETINTTSTEGSRENITHERTNVEEVDLRIVLKNILKFITKIWKYNPFIQAFCTFYDCEFSNWNTTNNEITSPIYDSENFQEEYFDQNVYESTNQKYHYQPQPNTETAEYYFLLGFSEWRKNQNWSVAKKYYEQSLTIDPEYPPALSSLGMGKIMFENDISGLDMIHHAISLDPSWAYAPYNLAIAYDYLGNWEESSYWIAYTRKNFSWHSDFSYFEETFRMMEQTHFAR